MPSARTTNWLPNTTETPWTAVKTFAYAYEDANWKDKLTKYDGKAITYDAIGNPLNDGTWTYTWTKGRQLASMSKPGTGGIDGNGGASGTGGTSAMTVSYHYNADGLRIKKTVNGIITAYTLHGKQIMHMTQGGNSLHFYYDGQGRPAIVNFNGTRYAYMHNLQGDIIGLVDQNGNTVVEYRYDAWGKAISKTGSLVSTLGTVNPFRYRGYVYDEETELYYLRSRYYNPTWCRFVHADTLMGKVGGLSEHNLFTYCKNSPVTRFDPSGRSMLLAIITIAAAAILLTGCSPTDIEPYADQANCYAYAMKLEYDPRTGSSFKTKPQPGEFSGSSLTVSDLKKDATKVKNTINEKVTADLQILKLNYTEVDSAEHVPKQGNWVVALAYSTSYVDYHWWRKNDDGTWYHKPGSTPIMQHDMSGNTISDPGNCDRGIYDGFLGYYEVGPN